MGKGISGGALDKDGSDTFPITGKKNVQQNYAPWACQYQYGEVCRTSTSAFSKSHPSGWDSGADLSTMV